MKDFPQNAPMPVDHPRMQLDQMTVLQNVNQQSLKEDAFNAFEGSISDDMSVISLRAALKALDHHNGVSGDTNGDYKAQDFHTSIDSFKTPESILNQLETARAEQPAETKGGSIILNNLSIGSPIDTPLHDIAAKLSASEAASRMEAYQDNGHSEILITRINPPTDDHPNPPPPPPGTPEPPSNNPPTSGPPTSHPPTEPPHGPPNPPNPPHDDCHDGGGCHGGGDCGIDIHVDVDVDVAICLPVATVDVDADACVNVGIGCDGIHVHADVDANADINVANIVQVTVPADVDLGVCITAGECLIPHIDVNANVDAAAAVNVANLVDANVAADVDAALCIQPGCGLIPAIDADVNAAVDTGLTAPIAGNIDINADANLDLNVNPQDGIQLDAGAGLNLANDILPVDASDLLNAHVGVGGEEGLAINLDVAGIVAADVAHDGGIMLNIDPAGMQDMLSPVGTLLADLINPPADGDCGPGLPNLENVVQQAVAPVGDIAQDILAPGGDCGPDMPNAGDAVEQIVTPVTDIVHDTLAWGNDDCGPALPNIEDIAHQVAMPVGDVAQDILFPALANAHDVVQQAAEPVADIVQNILTPDDCGCGPVAGDPVGDIAAILPPIVDNATDIVMGSENNIMTLADDLTDTVQALSGNIMAPVDTAVANLTDLDSANSIVSGITSSAGDIVSSATMPLDNLMNNTGGDLISAIVEQAPVLVAETTGEVNTVLSAFDSITSNVTDTVASIAAPAVDTLHDTQALQSLIDFGLNTGESVLGTDVPLTSILDGAAHAADAGVAMLGHDTADTASAINSAVSHTADWVSATTHDVVAPAVTNVVSSLTQVIASPPPAPSIGGLLGGLSHGSTSHKGFLF